MTMHDSTHVKHLESTESTLLHTGHAIQTEDAILTVASLFGTSKHF